MEADVVGALVEYGVLGLWTLSLLYSNRSMAKRFDAERQDTIDAREKTRAEVISRLDEIDNKVDEGLRAMREKYQEERLQQMIRTRGYRTQTLTKVEDKE